MDNVTDKEPLLAFSRMKMKFGRKSFVPRLPFRLCKSSNVHVSQSLQLST